MASRARGWRWWAAAVGGGLWATHAVVLAVRPEGCVGEACHRVGSVMPRPSEDLVWLFLPAVFLLACAVPPRRVSGFLRAGVALLWAGVVLLVAGAVINRVVDGDSPLWWLHDTDSLGRFLPVAGSALVGAAVLRSGLTARWPGVALVLAALLTLGFNVQDARVLLTVPLGLAWVTLGLSLRRRSGRGRTTEAPRGTAGAGEAVGGRRVRRRLGR